MYSMTQGRYNLFYFMKRKQMEDEESFKRFGLLLVKENIH